MSQEKSDVFRMDIGNLKKGENCQIRISYVQELKMDDHKIRFRLPQSIAPRYVCKQLSLQVQEKFTWPHQL